MNFASIFIVVAVVCCLSAASDPSRKICSDPACVNSGNENPSNVILCNRCMVILLSHTDKAKQFFKFQKKVINGEGKTLLTDLNEDVVYHIVDQLYLADTINLLKAYPNQILSRMANGIFRRKYKQHTVVIEAWPESTELGTIRTIDIDVKTVRIAQIEISKSVLEHFGSSVERLKIDSRTNFPAQNRLYSTLSKFIYTYAKKLKYLNLDYVNGDTFDHFNQVFDHVLELSFTIYGDKDIIKPGNLPLNELFPKLQRLDVHCNTNIDYSSIFRQFPYLEHLKLSFTDERNGEKIFEGILSKNPQIKSIETEEMTKYLYNFTQKFQLKLEHLNVQIFRVSGVRLDNLKSLVVTYINPVETNQLFTPLLESLDIKYNSNIDEEWVPFLQRHTNVSRLTIHELIANGGDKIMQLIRLLPNLTELSIDHTDKFRPIPTYTFISEILNEVITTSQNLEKFNFMTEPVLTEAELNTIRERYQNDWELVVESFQRENKDVINFSFEKKKVLN